MFPFYPQQPPYYPPPMYNSADDALKLAKAMIKEGRRIKRDLEATKKPEKKEEKKSMWEKLDTLHVFFFMMSIAPIIGIISLKVLKQLIN